MIGGHVSAGLILAITVLELAVTAGAPAAVLRMAEVGLLLPFLILACFRARGMALALGLGSIAGALILLPDPGRQWTALQEAGPFAAFLASLQLLRAVAANSPLVSGVREKLAHFPPAHRLAVMEIAGVILGAVVANGAHPILAAFLDRNQGAEQRRHHALAALRGICLASLWSPFFLALPFIASRLPSASFPALVGGGMAFALIGLTIDLALGAVGPGSLAIIARILAPLASILLVFAGLVATLVILARLTPLSATGVAVLALVAAQLLLDRRPAGARALFGQAWRGLSMINDEMLLLASALLLAHAAVTHADWLKAAGPALATLPHPLILLGIMALLVGGGLIGLHPTFTASLAIASAPLLPTLSPLALASVLLAAWGLATMVSPASLTVLVAAQMFDVPNRRLVLSANLARALISGAVAALACALL